MKPQDLAVESQDPVELTIEGVASDGRGVGREGGRVWFVERALPGDRVEALPKKVRPRFVEGVVGSILEPSELRREPPCPEQARCGGCPLMPLEEAEQRRLKAETLRQALRRIGKLPEPSIEPVVHGAPLRYRNRVEFRLTVDASGRAVVGLAGEEESGAGAVVEVAGCSLQAESANATLHRFREFLARPEVVESLARRAPGRCRVALRVAPSGQQLLAIQEDRWPFPAAKALADWLPSRCPELVGLVTVATGAGRRGGAKVETLWGRPWLEERAGQDRFRLPGHSFFQVHTGLVDELVGLVLRPLAHADADAASRGTLLDLYAGVGIFGLAAARRGLSVESVEADPSASACGADAARRGQVSGIRFVRADVRKYLPLRTERPDWVVADPPRSGMGEPVTSELIRLRPPRITLVSCSPQTLARDLTPLCDAGYRIERMTPIDLFPQTAHLEVVTQLES